MKCAVIEPIGIFFWNKRMVDPRPKSKISRSPPASTRVEALNADTAAVGVQRLDPGGSGRRTADLRFRSGVDHPLVPEENSDRLDHCAFHHPSAFRSCRRPARYVADGMDRHALWLAQDADADLWAEGHGGDDGESDKSIFRRHPDPHRGRRLSARGCRLRCP